jgi:urea transport system permease protein
VLSAFAVCLWAADDAALTAAMGRLSSDDAAERKGALDELGRSRDARLIPFLTDYFQGSVFRWQDRVVVAPDTTDSDAGKMAILLDPLTRQPVQAGAVPLADLTPIVAGRRDKMLANEAKNALSLFVPERQARLTAVTRLGDSGEAKGAALLEDVLAVEQDRGVRAAANESLLLLRVADADPAKAEDRRAAITAIGAVGSARGLSHLQDLLASKPDEATAAATRAAIARIESWQGVVHAVGHLFSGLSTGSILILIALGLAIIFGLMGVINMAHGELVMIGAYATFLTQKAFEAWLPAAWLPGYFLVAIPVSFLIAGAMGWIIEQAVIRWLYGRPLETLLATCGVSLVLSQLVRWQFGDNCSVNSPAWLQGGVEVMSGLVLPYARIFIIGFCMVCIAGTVLLIGRTRLGLLLRATTQNRPMAAALGVKTRAIDGWAFALGSGIAGMAGCALTLLGGISPNMGQEYVVDSFLVVVVGGVGKLAGVIIAGLGLGGLTKLFEPWTAAVWAKVLVLLCVIVFIQWKPSGIFPQKGRMADA